MTAPPDADRGPGRGPVPTSTLYPKDHRQGTPAAGQFEAMAS
jgi:hypothetical protein